MAQNKRKQTGTQARSSEPLFNGAFEAVLWGAALATVAGVAFYFDSDVNRIFDIPKAQVLKIGGCALFIAWLVGGLWVRGIPSRSIALFGPPMLAWLAAVGLSTALSFDVATAFHGVYERQFGMQGYLACAGLFVVAATAIRSRTGAYVGFGCLALIAGAVGSYAALQGWGLDPLEFFNRPNNKTFSFLGNATFAGNALASVFPLSLTLAAVALGFAFRSKGPDGADPVPVGLGVGAGLAANLALQLGLGILLATQVADPSTQFQLEAGARYATGLALSLAVVPGLAAGLGSAGPGWLRPESPGARRFADGVLAGSLAAASVGILLGLWFTRTRGAWSGTAVALLGMGLLLPWVHRHRTGVLRWWTLRIYPPLFGAVLLGGAWVLSSDHLVARTIKSIPQDMNPYRKGCGKGQCTRPLLWMESPRVLMDHDETLDRLNADRADLGQRVDPDILPGVPLQEELNPVATGWRSAKVWLFGIGIETYRYAFMSHKSKRLEELDPMTNHDNPHNNYLYLLASLGFVGLAAYLWLLGRVLWVALRHSVGHAFSEDAPDREHRRTIALGILASFFSYSVYSLAGFDSVLCSVFLFFLLGTAAVFFRPNAGQPTLEWWGPQRLAWPLRAGVTVLLLPLLVLGIFEAQRVYAADRAFADRAGLESGQGRSIQHRIEQVEKAISLHRDESYYRQELGSLHQRISQGWLRRARQLQQARDPQKAREALARSRQSARQAEVALASALHRAWAPENVYITMYQLFAGLNQRRKAERALEQALMHSPHLAPVRLSLAQLQLDRNAHEDALKNCRWVLDVDARNASGHRVCGFAQAELGNRDAAERHLRRALQLDPDDVRSQRRLDQLRAELRQVAAAEEPRPSSNPPDRASTVQSASGAATATVRRTRGAPVTASTTATAAGTDSATIRRR